ncbi:iron uptake porin [Leptolyngbya boryana CZ1]|uniref:Iron uptake porin n=1 Tax=Leptolyngbya boryana CZ1 TaxID=3060204 RepID=A0AA97AWP2_LEPBY|nr:iron uptake porin [Leptolyngbya boryana]WNZ48490.1 iron uptake porin [Leptolyngbya boryana CZ1]
MRKSISSLLWASPIVLGVSLWSQANAAEVKELPASSENSLSQLAAYSSETSEVNAAGQVTSVSQLSDVRPTDWAFQALQSLVERYGCIAGYPDRTYRGNRALTRYEFAAGLNACLDRVNELIAAATADLVKKEDLATLQQLQEQFAAELATLRGRVDSLEARTTTLEKQQFSTTTKLSGEVIFGIAGVVGEDRALNSDQWRVINAAPAGAAREAARTAAFGAAGRDVQDNTVFSNRVRLDLNTSLTGKDRLFTRLEASNTTAFNTPVTGTSQTRLGYDTTSNPDNSVQLGKLFYRFPLGTNLNVTVDAIGGEFYDNFNTFNPLFASASTGSVSRFGRFSPIYRASNTGSGSNTGAGVSAVLKLSDSLSFSAGYIARRPNDPAESRGLLDGSYGAIAQLAFQPNRDFALGLSYARSYFSGANNDVSVSGAYGSAFANQPFGNVATSANHFGLQATYRFSPKFTVSAWGLYTQAIAENGKGLATVNTGDKADIWSWAVSLGFPDLGGKGNLAGIIFGQPPKVTNSDFGPPVLGATTARRRDEDTTLHLEGLYRFQLSDKISITPGLIVIFNPENNSNNDTLYVGVVRTTFRF